MKINLTLLLCFLVSTTAICQNEVAITKSYLNQNNENRALSISDIEDMVISSEYLSPSTGWYHIYFTQTYQSIEVYNGILNATLQNGEVKYIGNTFVQNIASLIPKNTTSDLNLSPIQAIEVAANSKNLAFGKAELLNSTFVNNNQENGILKATYTDKTLSDEDIVIKKYWLPHMRTENGRTTFKAALTWNVRFLTKDHLNQWNFHVDVATGDILQEQDDIIHCDFGTPMESNKAFKSHTHIKANNVNEVAERNSYHVFDYPLENPTVGSRTVVTNPYARFVGASIGPGATNGWHNDGTTDFTTTRGNNVWAKDDIAADNEATIGGSPVSATLDFNYAYSQTLNSAAANRDAAITNLFYWNNVMHDVLYKYGFDEPSGNFQNNNMGRGGLENDYIFADAQDGSGTNNANFSRSIDGQNARMQMFIFSDVPRPPGTATYQPDSDFDNGIIAHEYGHGWSGRLTGGAANGLCLINAEQAGEGWSDYASLMLTTDWASLTPSLASANISKTIGSYAVGAGIRPFPYSYDMANVNPTVTYGKVADATNFSLPHGIGSIWATMLWDMTWEIIFQDNEITANIYDTPANVVDMKGNVAALKLVNEGLRLQPCSPSFVQARNAILQADAMLFNGRYACSISKAFARRGLGALASTGLSTNDRIITEDFTAIAGPVLTSSNQNNICSNEVFNYTPTVGVTGTYTFNWIRATKDGISNATASGTGSINETLVNTSLSPIDVEYFYTVNPASCAGSLQQSVKVTVNPIVIPTVASYKICQNASVPDGEGLKVPEALTYIVSDAITAGPTFLRTSSSSTTYVNSGVSAFYKTIPFFAPITEAATFQITDAALTVGFPQDTYLSLYLSPFDPANPEVNFLRADDFSNGNYRSKLSHNLTAGSTYVLVVSTFSAGATGTFTLHSNLLGFSGGVNNWYDSPSGGSALSMGEVFNPIGITGSGLTNTSTLGTTTFYVSTNFPPSCRTPVTFNVVPQSVTPLVLTDNYNSGTTLDITSETITATNEIASPARAVYKAEKSISLTEGFEAKSGSSFKAEIGGCE